MSIIPKERALPIIQNTFRRQLLVEKLCKITPSDGGDFNVDLVGMVEGIFHFDYSEFQDEQYDHFFDAFWDLLQNDTLDISDKARLYYDKILDLVAP